MNEIDRELSINEMISVEYFEDFPQVRKRKEKSIRFGFEFGSDLV